MKKFWRILKKILMATFVLSCAALFVVVLTSAMQKQEALTCQSLTVKIDYDSGLAFLSEDEIKERINFLSGENIIGKQLARVDFRTIEKELEKNPYVAEAEVYVDQQQKVTATVIQKRPILRILNNDGVGFYISENNEHMPLCDKFTSHVPLAIGAVEMHKNAGRDSSVQAALYKLAQFIRTDVFLNSLVDQIAVDEKGEIELIPKVQGHIIRFGNAEEDMQGKFERLKIFYREGLKNVGWNKYKTIDLRFVNQVVCEKKDTTQIL